MSDLATTLWQAFEAESDEHLGALEPALVGLANTHGAGRTAEVASIFRAFHSLKGLARAMSRYGMEGVAHEAESLLGLVRDHGATVDEEMLDALLAAVDGLKSLRGHASARLDDEPPPPALVTRLQRAIALAGGASSLTDPLVEQPATPGAGLQSDPSPLGGNSNPSPLGGNSNPSPLGGNSDPSPLGGNSDPSPLGGNSDPSPLGDNSDPSPLGDDPEMLGLYAETMQAGLPELATLLSADEACREHLADTVQSLAHGARVMELDALAETLDAIDAELAARSLPLDDAGRAALMEPLQELADKAALLAEMLELDTGAASLAASLAGDAPAGFPGTLLARLDDLSGAIAAGDDDVQALAQDVCRLIATLRPSAAADLVALLADLCARLATGAIVGSLPLASAFADVATSGQDLTNLDLAAALAAGLRSALDRPGSGDEAGALALSGQLIETLDPAQRQELSGALAAGQHTYSLMLFLELAPVVAGKLLAWLPTVCRMPTNRSVFRQDESWFEILLVTELASDALAAGLLQLDPDRSCLRELKQLRAAGDLSLPLGPAGDTPAALAPAAPASGGELRIQGVVIDRFMDVVSEVRARLATLDDLLSGPGARAGLAALASLGKSIPEAGAAAASLLSRHKDAAEQMERLAAQLRHLHGAALEIRIVPIDLAFNRLPRMVRALAREQEKEVDFVLEGREVRVDKAIVDRLVEPLMHMVRNGIDHGIERPEQREAAGKPRRATLLIRATQAAGEVVVLVRDDGRGLDRDRILARAVERGLVEIGDAGSMSADAVNRLVFAPGFSTAASLTETSGRGVGMDVVLTEVHRLGGDIAIETAAGLGTSLRLRLPLTAATQAAVLVRATGQTLALPERAVAMVAEVARSSLATLDGRPSFNLRGHEIPVVELGRLLWPEDPVTPPALMVRLVVVTHEGEAVAFEVERVLGRQELLLLRLHPQLSACPYVGGAAVLGNEEVVLSLDTEALVAAAAASTWQVTAA